MNNAKARLAAAMLTLSCLSTARAGTETEYQEFAGRIGDELRARDFAALDREADQYRRDRSRLSDGLWKLALLHGAVFQALSDIVSSPRRKEEFESDLTHFEQDHPDSQTTLLIMAQTAEAIGFDARGGGYANTVTPQGWHDFRLAMDGARAILDANRERLAANPEWYVLRMEVAIYRDEPQAGIKALFEEGMRREPAYLPLYQTMQLDLSPLWHGSNRQLMDFVNDVGHRSPAAAAEGLYARLVWNASTTYRRIEFDPRLDWAAMRQGMNAVVATYPAERNVQQFFFMACSHPDKEQATKLLALVHEPPSRDLLRENTPLFGLCQQWASGKMPEFLMRDPDTGEGRLIK